MNAWSHGRVAVSTEPDHLNLAAWFYGVFWLFGELFGGLRPLETRQPELVLRWLPLAAAGQGRDAMGRAFSCNRFASIGLNPLNPLIGIADTHAP